MKACRHVCVSSTSGMYARKTSGPNVRMNAGDANTLTCPPAEGRANPSRTASFTSPITATFIAGCVSLSSMISLSNCIFRTGGLKARTSATTRNMTCLSSWSGCTPARCESKWTSGSVRVSGSSVWLALSGVKAFKRYASAEGSAVLVLMEARRRVKSDCVAWRDGVYVGMCARRIREPKLVSDSREVAVHPVRCKLVWTA